MSWWDAVYRSGNVPWDPGEYDRHLPAILKRLQRTSGRVFDAGCGNGKNSIWLAERRFEVVGVDQSVPAIEAARRRAASRGVEARARFIAARLPDDLGSPLFEHMVASGGFDLVIERAFLQHVGGAGALERTVNLLGDLLNDGGALYSLMIASEGTSCRGGITRWSQREIRRALEPTFFIEEMHLDVFTPGEPGSVPAWVTVARPDRERRRWMR